MSREAFPVGTTWVPKSSARGQYRRARKHIVAHQKNPNMITVVAVRDDGSLSPVRQTFHWRAFDERYEPAHNAHLGGTESGTCRSLSQDDV